MLAYRGQLQNQKLDLIVRKSKNQKIYHCEDILSLDIETTSFWIDKNKNVIGYHKGESEEYWNSLRPMALPYIWQFSFNDVVYMGREWRDFLNVLNDLPKTKNGREIHYKIWVHNLAWEFHFLLSLLTVKEVKARTSHSPMCCVFEEYPNIEFRCTFYLTNMSLMAVGEELGLAKMVGDLDYMKIRTPRSELSAKELKYCERDCEIVYRLIQREKKEYGTLSQIPYTSTGKVRRVVKKKLMSNKKYQKYIKTLIPKTEEEYAFARATYAGGYSHCNALYYGQTLSGLITHWDFTSSYPYSLLKKIYPISPFITETYPHIPSDEEMENNCFIFLVYLEGVNSIKCNSYIQVSKLEIDKSEGIVADNGRVRQADSLALWVTEYDWDVIKQAYSYDRAEVLYQMKANKGYLPREFLDYVLELYENKTKLKGTDQEDLYNQLKAYLNSLYGMMVTAILMSDLEFSVDKDGITQWTEKEITDEEVNDKLDKMRNDFTDSSYFLSYYWGIYCSAEARNRLWQNILENDQNVIYCDTDSIFMLGEGDFSLYNKQCERDMQAMCKEMGFDYSRCKPKTIKGVEKHIGFFDKEKDICEFISLGSKRYAYRLACDNTLHITVSGVNKEAVACLNDDITNFADGFVFDKDGEGMNKKLHVYCDNMPSVVMPDGYVCNYRYGINLRPTGYTMTVNDDYDTFALFIQSLKDGSFFEKINNEYLVHKRGIYTQTGKLRKTGRKRIEDKMKIIKKENNNNE